MGGDSNPWCLATHTLSRRAQSTALSPILSTHAHSQVFAVEHEHELQLQAPEQVIERQLNADEEFSEIRVVGTDAIKAHFVDDFLDLESVARKKRDAPLRIIKAGRAGDELFHFAGTLATNFGVAAHQFAAVIKRQGIPVSLFAAPLAHITEADHRPARERRINAFL